MPSKRMCESRSAPLRTATAIPARPRASAVPRPYFQQKFVKTLHSQSEITRSRSLPTRRRHTRSMRFPQLNFTRMSRIENSPVSPHLWQGDCYVLGQKSLFRGNRIVAFSAHRNSAPLEGSKWQLRSLTVGNSQPAHLPCSRPPSPCLPSLCPAMTPHPSRSPSPTRPRQNGLRKPS